MNDKIVKKYTIENNLLYKISGKNKLIVINYSLALNLIIELHEMYAHIGANKIL